MNAQEFQVATTGIGRPDFSEEVSSGLQRAGIAVKYGQQLRIGGLVCDVSGPSFFPWTRGQLGIGETGYAIDYETGVVGTGCIAGQAVDLYDFDIATAIKVKVWLTLDTGLVANLGIIWPGNHSYVNPLKDYSTLDVDPEAALPHVIQCAIQNIDLVAGDCSIRGTYRVSTVHTPPFDINKIVKCHWCGFEWKVPREATVLICPKCGKKVVVFDFSHRRGVL